MKKYQESGLPFAYNHCLEVEFCDVTLATCCSVSIEEIIPSKVLFDFSLITVKIIENMHKSICCLQSSLDNFATTKSKEIRLLEFFPDRKPQFELIKLNLSFAQKKIQVVSLVYFLILHAFRKNHFAELAGVL